MYTGRGGLRLDRRQEGVISVGSEIEDKGELGSLLLNVGRHASIAVWVAARRRVKR
jgi:hypothetical protein